MKCPWCFSEDVESIPPEEVQDEEYRYRCLNCLVTISPASKKYGTRYKFTELVMIKITKNAAMRLFQLKAFEQNNGCHYGHSAYNQLQDIGFFRHVVDYATWYCEKNMGYKFPRPTRLPDDFDRLKLTNHLSYSPFDFEEEIRRLKGLVEFNERTINRLEIDNEKITKELAICHDAYNKCKKIEKKERNE